MTPWASKTFWIVMLGEIIAQPTDTRSVCTSRVPYADRQEPRQ